MIKKPVTVSIRGVQKADGQRNVTESFSKGHMASEKDRIRISYNEKIEGAGLVPSLLTFSRDGIRLVRKGDLPAEMEFACGRTTKADYDTGAGRIAFEIHTLALSVSEYEDGEAPQTLTAEVTYDLTTGGSLLSQNELTIRIEEEA